MTINRRAGRAQGRPASPEPKQVPRSALSNLWKWRARNNHLFPSDTSLRWHLRQHRNEYVASGALFEIAGRLACDPPKMEETLRKIGARAAAERDGTST